MDSFRWARSWVVALVVLGIGIATLHPTGTSAGATSFCLLCGERGLSDFISNVILFLPLGLVVGVRRGRLLHAIIAALLVSGSVEIAQIQLIAGRDANLGDVVANGVGTAAGWLLARLRPWQFGRRVATAPAVVLALITSAVLVAALATLQPALLAPPYYLFWTPDYENHDQYEGRVLSTRLGPLEWDSSYLRMQPVDRIRPLLQREPLEARMVVGPPPRRSAPLIAIQTREREILLLAVRGTDLVYRYWGISDELRLDHADLKIPRVFAGSAVGDTIDLAFQVRSAGYCVAVNKMRTCGPAFGVKDTWTLLVSPDWTDARMRLIGALWLWMVFLPAGFVAANPRVLLAVAAAASIAIALGPLLIGFGLTPWHQLGAVAVGILCGYGLATFHDCRSLPDEGASRSYAPELRAGS